MELKKGIGIFDFCGTLVDFQTANAFSEYAIKKNGTPKVLIELVRKVLYKTRFFSVLNIFKPECHLNKKLLLYELKGISKERIDEYGKMFYKEVIKPHLVKETLDELCRLKEKGMTIIVVSGGYDVYLRNFVNEYKVDFLLSSELLFDNDFFTGRMKNKDCMGKEKVSRIESFFNNKPLHELYEKSIGYSDSESDVPMLKLCDERVCIVSDQHRAEDMQWCKKISARVIKY